MYFDSLRAALLMEGHGAFVWSAYAMSSLVIAVLLIVPLRRRRALLNRLASESRRQRAHSGGAD